MHHFVVKFSKFLFASGRRQGGTDPPNQNRADVADSRRFLVGAPVHISTRAGVRYTAVKFRGEVCSVAGHMRTCSAPDT